MGIPLQDADYMSKLIPVTRGKPTALRDMRGARVGGHGSAPRGHQQIVRRACGGGGDLVGTARPADPAVARQLRRGDHAVLDGGRGAAWVAQDGFPRVAQPDHHRGGVPAAGARLVGRHLPDGVGGHAQSSAGDAADVPAGHFRGAGAVSSGSARRRPHPQVHRPEARPRGGHVRAPGAGADSERDLRHPGVSGADHGDGAHAGRLLDGAGGHLAACDGQEEDGRDATAAQLVHQRRPGAQRGGRGAGWRAVREDAQLCGLLLQQVALDGVRGDHLPDRLAQGQLPAGVCLCDVVGVRVVGRHRQAGAVSELQRAGTDVPRGPAVGERVGGVFRAAAHDGGRIAERARARHPDGDLRPGGHQESGRGRRQGHRAGATGERPAVRLAGGPVSAAGGG
eukprot:ctg_2145.g419